MGGTRRVELSVVSRTGEEFESFGPYVASVSEASVVAFWARRRGGVTGVYRSGGNGAEVVVEVGGDDGELVSHPDINAAGAVCVYGRNAAGRGTLVMVEEGLASVIECGAGPLGPTMNELGHVALRGAWEGGLACVEVWDGSGMRVVGRVGAELDGRECEGFAGLPVINGAGAVMVRAMLAGGEHGVYVVDRGGRVTSVAGSWEGFEELGGFASMNDRGEVGFAGRRSGRGWGGYVRGAEGTLRELDLASVLGGGRQGGRNDDGPCVRSVLVYEGRGVVVCATPAGGTLGVYMSRGEMEDGGGWDRVLGVGSELEGSVVKEFALNPVSVNGAGEAAIRVMLEDGQGLIVRAGQAVR